MQGIEEMCDDFMYFATQARLQSRMPNHSEQSQRRYMEELKTCLNWVGENDYPGHEFEYETTYLMLAVVGPIYERVHAKDLAKHFRFFAKKCMHQGVDPDIHDIIKRTVPRFRRRDPANKNGKQGRRRRDPRTRR